MKKLFAGTCVGSLISLADTSQPTHISDREKPAKFVYGQWRSLGHLRKDSQTRQLRGKTISKKKKQILISKRLIFY